jgi:hypothetical protein
VAVAALRELLGGVFVHPCVVHYAHQVQKVRKNNPAVGAGFFICYISNRTYGEL